MIYLILEICMMRIEHVGRFIQAIWRDSKEKSNLFMLRILLAINVLYVRAEDQAIPHTTTRSTFVKP